jgi:hypothetical protein
MCADCNTVRQIGDEGWEWAVLRPLLRINSC